MQKNTPQPKNLDPKKMTVDELKLLGFTAHEQREKALQDLKNADAVIGLVRKLIGEKSAPQKSGVSEAIKKASEIVKKKVEAKNDATPKKKK